MVTTAEIANKLGISRATVSRVLNNNPNVNENTRKMVIEEVKKMGYTPNEAARSLVMKKSRKIAVVVFSEPKFFWEQIKSGVNSAASELSTFGTNVDFFVTDILNPESQVDLIQRLPQEGYDAIALAPNNANILLEPVNKLIENGTPILLFNVDIPATNRLCYVGCDYIKSGMLAAEILAQSLNKTGDVCILTLKDQVMPIEYRITGFRSEISQYNNISIKSVIGFNRKSEGVYEEALKLIETNQNLKGIYVSFGALEQVAQAVIDSGKTRDINVVGYDLSNEIAEYIKKGAVTATICHEPFMQGYLSVKILHKYLDNGTLPISSAMYTKLEAIFRNNVDYYINEKDSFETLKVYDKNDL